MIKIRKAKKEDVRKISLLRRKTINKINSKYYPENMIKILVEKNNLKNTFVRIKEEEIFCLLKNKELLGTISFKKNKISGLYIKPKNIGKGYGKMLMKFIEKYAKEKRIKKLILYPTKNAEKFYLKLGYKKSGKISRWDIGNNKKLNIPEMYKKLK